MSDLIDRQAAIDAVRSYMADNEIEDRDWHADGIAYDIKRLPAAQPEIVRCKDCKWWERRNDGSYGYCHSCKHSFYSANWEIIIYRKYKEGFFCADGERRTDE